MIAQYVVQVLTLSRYFVISLYYYDNIIHNYYYYYYLLLALLLPCVTFPLSASSKYFERALHPSWTSSSTFAPRSVIHYFLLPFILPSGISVNSILQAIIFAFDQSFTGSQFKHNNHWDVSGERGLISGSFIQPWRSHGLPTLRECN